MLLSIGQILVYLCLTKPQKVTILTIAFKFVHECILYSFINSPQSSQASQNEDSYSNWYFCVYEVQVDILTNEQAACDRFRRNYRGNVSLYAISYQYESLIELRVFIRKLRTSHCSKRYKARSISGQTLL